METEEWTQDLEGSGDYYPWELWKGMLGRGVTRREVMPPVPTPWHVEFEALCGLFMTFLKKEI